MKEPNKFYCDTSRVTIREIKKSVAESMVVKHHYSHAWTSCRYALGVFYKNDTPDVLGNFEELIGCLVYGFPVGRLTVKSITDDLQNDECLELTRMYIHDGYGSNIESYCISQSFRWLKENAPTIKVLISYADPEQDHEGKVYQATNWLYQSGDDIKLIPSYWFSVTNPHKWIHERSVNAKWGTVSVSSLKTILGKNGISEFWTKPMANKHRYLQILTDKREKRQIMAKLKHPLKPYPTSSPSYNHLIERHETHTPKQDSGFW